MAQLDFRGKLVGTITGWYRPEVLVNVADGSAPPGNFWEDSSGFDRDLEFTGAGAVVKHDVLNGYSVVDLNGTTGELDSQAVNASSFINNNAGFVVAVAKVRTIGTDNATVVNNAALWAVNSASSCGIYFRSSNGATFHNNDGAGQNVVRAITLGQWIVYFWRHGGGNLYGSILADVLLPGTSVASGNTANLSNILLIGRNHQATPVYLDAQLVELLFCNATKTGNALHDLQIVLNYVKAKYSGRGDAHAQAIRVGADWLYRNRQPRLLITVPELPPRALDLDLGDEFGLAHPLAPHPSGDGTGPRPWELLPLRVVSARADFERRLVKLVGEYRRTHLFYAAAKAGAVPGTGLAVSAINPGPIYMKRVAPAGSVAADGLAWVPRANDGLVDALFTGDPKITPDGVLCEIDARQNIQDSALIAGAPEWTLVNPTGGTVQYVLTDTVGQRLFAQGVTTRCLEFSRGTSGTGTAQAPLSAGMNVGSGKGTILQIDVRGVLTGAVYRLQNASGNYWDNAAKSWVAGVTDNAITDTEGDGQYVSNPITLPAALSTLTIRQNTGVGSAGDKLYVLYAGLPQDRPVGVGDSRLRWKCSRVVQNSTSTDAHMGQDYGLIWPNHTGKRNFLSELGAALMRVKFNFDAANVLNINSVPMKFTLLHVYYDASNYVWLHYYVDSAGPTREFRLDVRAAGTTYRATLAYEVARNQTISVWGRWTSAAGGELDKPARTLTVGVDAQVGADVQAAALPTNVNLSFLGVGAWAGGAPLETEGPLCGFWKVCEILPVAPPDDVMKAWRF